ncbi:MAG: hypothetical protein KatS3mg076_1425 [Candidatus Binatia bacterium]|nr:MAG: hypothetical protein KatS3mg076_1425 [Candidatus Binatia bacterium]
MIYLHETYEIAGGRMAEFLEAYRDRRGLFARGNARVLWLWEQAHGTGPSYRAVSVTAVADWSSWAELVGRWSRGGDLRAWDRAVAPFVRERTAKLLLPVSWSPLGEPELGTAEPLPHGGHLYLHDTGWPFPGKLEEYVDALGEVFYPQTRRSRMISVEACWTVCPGTGKSREVVLLQKILDWEAFSRLLTSGERPARSGDWMEVGLRYRDSWESKLLRPVS